MNSRVPPHRQQVSSLESVADPRFPRGGGANSQGGSPTYEFAKISQKLHEIERILDPGGGGARPKFYYVDPPLRMIRSDRIGPKILLDPLVILVDGSQSYVMRLVYSI